MFLGVILLKKYLCLFAVTVLLIIGSVFIPIGIKNSYKSVKAIKILKTSVISTVTCSGNVEAIVKREITLPYQVKINQNLFNIGDRVEKGNILFDIDETVTKQAISTNNENSLMSETNTQMSSSNALNTLQEALNSGIITSETYNSLAEKIKNNSGSINTSSDSSSSSGSKENEDAMETIKECIKAPMSGVITSIADGTGGITPAGTVVATISDLNSLQIKAMVDEKNVKNVKVGQTAIITGTGFSGSYYGTVKQIYPVVDKVTTENSTKNMVGIIVSINKKDCNMMPGASVDLTIKTSEKSNVIKVPYSALRQDNNGDEYVFIFKNGTAVKRMVTTGSEDDNGVEIVKGIQSGDIVIDDSSDSLKNGELVRLS